MAHRLGNFFSLLSRRARTQVKNTLEGIQKVAGAEIPRDNTLWKFASTTDLDKLHTYGDYRIGGGSTCEASYQEDIIDGKPVGSVLFKGRTVTEHPKAGVRSGFAAIYQQVDLSHFWDLDLYTGIEMRVKADARRYTLNLVVDSVHVEGIYQGFMLTPRPLEWVTMQIRFQDLILTQSGEPKSVQYPIDPRYITNIADMKAIKEVDDSYEFIDSSLTEDETPRPLSRKRW